MEPRVSREAALKAWKHPATILASLALFVALSGGAALAASGLISGDQIVNHSIPAKKLTPAAINALQGQRGPAGPRGVKGATGPRGPGAISIAKYQAAATDGDVAFADDAIDGLTLLYTCNPSANPAAPSWLGFELHVPGPVTPNFVFSGESAADGALKSVQFSGQSSGFINFHATSTLNVDGIVWIGTGSKSGGKVLRVDLGGRVNGTTSCDVWGQITPSS